MNQLTSSTRQQTPTHLAVLILGDLLVILSFVWIGRSSHGLSTANLGAGFFTALPFIIGWFLITPWVGLYRSTVNQNWRSLLPRLLLGWAMAVPAGLALHALFLGRSIPDGIMPLFALIAMGYIGLVILLWRLAYIWWANRNAKLVHEIREAEL